jgi:hypothetical protein
MAELRARDSAQVRDAAPAPGQDAAQGEPAPAPRLSRRAGLRAAGVAGAAALAATLGTTERAEAANGDPIVIGSTANTGTAVTRLTGANSSAFEGVGAPSREGVTGTCNGSLVQSQGRS